MPSGALIEAMAAKTGSTKAEAARVVAALTEIIADPLKKGDSVSLIGFGTFEVRSRGAHTGRNPKTGEELKIAASKVPAFKPGVTVCLPLLRLVPWLDTKSRIYPG